MLIGLKLMKDNSQSGRSMIEMLGVLAIIGVLTVGGIAGFSKAMLMYRTNKTIDQIAQAVTRTRVAFIAQKNYRGIGTSEEEIGAVLVSADIIPQEYLVRDKDGNAIIPYRFYNPFKGKVSLRMADKLSPEDKAAFVFRYDFIPKPACIAIVTSPWGDTNGIGFIGLAINEPLPEDMYIDNCVASDSEQTGHAIFCTNSGIMPNEVAAKACSNQKDNTIELLFY